MANKKGAVIFNVIFIHFVSIIPESTSSSKQQNMLYHYDMHMTNIAM